MATRVAARKGLRVYHYVSDDGTTFWSFTRYMRPIMRNQELRLQSRLGTHLVNYINELRWTGQSFEDTETAEKM